MAQVFRHLKSRCRSMSFARPATEIDPYEMRKFSAALEGPDEIEGRAAVMGSSRSSD